MEATRHPFASNIRASMYLSFMADYKFESPSVDVVRRCATVDAAAAAAASMMTMTRTMMHSTSAYRAAKLRRVLVVPAGLVTALYAGVKTR